MGLRVYREALPRVSLRAEAAVCGEKGSCAGFGEFTGLEGDISNVFP